MLTTIQSLGQRGEGIAEADGKRVYVPFTLPGERTASLTVTGIDGLRSSSTARIEVVGDLVTTFQPDRLRRPAGDGD